MRDRKSKRRNRNAAARWRTSRSRKVLAAATLLLACLSFFAPATAQDGRTFVAASLVEMPDSVAPASIAPAPTTTEAANRPLILRSPDDHTAAPALNSPAIRPGANTDANPETAANPTTNLANAGTLESLVPEKWTSPEGLSSTIQMMLLLAVLSLAPAALMMTTCFVRVVVVLSLLRQAIGTQQLPPTQVITTLSLFITFLVMTPTWKEVYNDAIVPYTEKQISLDEAWDRGTRPIHRFMSAQIERTGNTDDIHLFLDYIDCPTPTCYEEVPLRVMLPAFMLSELKTAFLIGFQIYLPFLILDMVISAVLVSMGMLMLPPVVVSLPFKILLFVLVDGWHLVVGMLLQSLAFT